MRRSRVRAGPLVPVLVLCAAAACSRQARTPQPLPPLRGDAVWLADGIGPGDPGVEQALAKFHCAAVFLPARRILRTEAGWSGSEVAAPLRPFSRIPVVLVISAESDPLEGSPKERQKRFGAFLAKEIEAAVSRRPAFGPLRGVHLDIPFSDATAQAHAVALKEARSLLSHGLSRAGQGGPRLPRDVALTWSLRRPPPNEKKPREAVQALASRTDGFVAFVFGDDNGADPAFTDSLGKLWWAGYEPAGAGVVRRTSGESGPRVPDGALDPLTNDPRLELVQEVPWNEEKGWEFTLRATRSAVAGGLTLAAGDSVTFALPSLADMLARFGSDRARRRFARGRLVVFQGTSDAARLFPISALADALAGHRGAPDLQIWESPEGRQLRVGAENGNVHASLVSRVQNWVEVDLAPARVWDVEPGAFDRWEVYDGSGRPVSPGRASRVRLFETLVAPLERFAPARLQVRGTLPSPCCRTRTHVAPAAGGEPVTTDWALPALASPKSKVQTPESPDSGLRAGGSRPRT